MSESTAADDSRLIEAAQRGDRTAFETLVTQHKAGLFRLARRFLGNGDDAYDVVQDTFVATWLALGRFDPQQPFGPWLRTILLNKCRDFSRRRAVRHRLIRWLTLTVEAQDSTHFAPAQDEAELRDNPRLQALDQAIAQLPARYKEPLVLTALMGLSHRSAGEQLGLTAKAVELRVHRARKRLQTLLSRGEP